jgi:predicted metal-binding membrane protein
MAVSAEAPRRPGQRFDALELGLIAALTGLAALAWALSSETMAGMDMGPGSELGSLSFFAYAWAVMMVAMMLPSVVPTVRTYALIERSRRARPALGEQSAAIVAFLAGYLLVWTGFGLAAHAIFGLGRGLGIEAFSWARGGRYLAGGVIVAAAVYQITPLKHVCLSRCRSPLDFLGMRWRDGLGGALRLGLEHGAWCVGCYWAVMAALFALGVMSLGWMAFVAALIGIEKLAGWRTAANRAIAVTLVVLGLAVMLAPERVPGLTLPSPMAAPPGPMGLSRGIRPCATPAAPPAPVGACAGAGS